VANQGVKIVVSAEDRAKRTFDQIQGRLARLGSGAVRVARGMVQLGSTVGPMRLRNAIGGIGRATRGVLEGLTKVAPVLGVITGAATVGGMVRLATAWANFGTNLGTASRAMGVAPRRLMQLQNAARLAGGSAESMTSALEGLSHTQFAVRHGLDPQARQIFAQINQLNGAHDDLANMKPDQAIERIFDALRKIPAGAARSAAAMQIFGGATSGLQPILQATAQELARYERMAEHYGVLNEKGIQAANRLRGAQMQLTLAVEGFGNTLAEGVEPVLTPILQQMAEWINTNRTFIAQNVADYIRRIATWLRNGGWDRIKGDIKGIWVEIETIVDKLGGWKSAAKDAAIAMGVLFGANVLSGAAALLTSLTGIAGAMAAIKAAGAGGACGCLEGGRKEPTMGKTNAARGAAAAEGAAEAGAVPALRGVTREADSMLVQSRRPSLLRRAGSTLATEFERTGASDVAGFGFRVLGRVVAPIALGSYALSSDPLNSNESALLDARRKRGFRNNNPGNLNFVGQTGATMETGVDHPRFARFRTMDDGLRAMASQLGRYGDRGKNTLRSIISTYAPKSDNNDPAGYAGQVSRRLGIGIDTPLDLHDPETVSRVMDGMIRREQGVPVPMGQIREALGIQAPNAVYPAGAAGSVPGASASDQRLQVTVTTQGQPGTQTRVSGSSGVRVTHTDNTHHAMPGALSAQGF